jgi:D-alanyl-D-alanine carboxypeptidase/D-alanyl-D-alanine-endopeptidase (penicillin-binding protein 4)
VPNSCGLKNAPIYPVWVYDLPAVFLGFFLLVSFGSRGFGAVIERDEPPAFSQRAANLDQRVRKVLETPGYQHGHWGILVLDARDGRTILEHNSEELFAPASVSKLFSTAAALLEFGPDFRFETPVYRRGEVDAEGVLHGDLILLAQGDLCMGGRTGEKGALLFKDDDHTYAGGNPRSDITGGDPLAGLDHLAREIRASGVKRVTGEITIDDRLFDAAESSGSGPRRLSPILINDNVVDVLVEPAPSSGAGAKVSFVPQTDAVSIDAQVETVAAGQQSSLQVHSLGPRRFTVRGKIPAGHRRVVLIHEVDDPASFARALFIEALRRRGVVVDASPLDANSTSRLASAAELARLPRVAVYTSPPFREFVKVILKVSHNLHASTLPMLLAARHGERSLEAGLRRQGQVLKKLGLDPEAISFGGGAGGSRADLVTPRATIALLRAMAARPESAAYHAALPILGRDGTLARAVESDSPARGHVHAKTGTYWVDNELTGKAVLTSKALAGYLETASGRPLIVAFFVNNVGLDAPRPGQTVSEATAAAGRLMGKLCEVFYQIDSDSSPARPPHPEAPTAPHSRAGDDPRD